MNDWFEHLDAAEKKKVADEYRRGPQDMQEIAPGAWGYFGFVECIGDREQMRRVAAKKFRDKFHAQPCPMGYYTTEQLENWRTVAERLPA